MIEWMFKQVFGASIFESVYSHLSINLFDTAGQYKSALQVVTSLYDTIITPVALSLLCIYFMIGMVDKLTSEHFTWDQALRQFCMLLAGFALIDYGLDIMNWLFKIGLLLTQDIHGTVSSDGGTVSEETIKALYNTFLTETELTQIKIFEFVNTMYRFVYLIIPFIISWAINIVVMIVVYSRVIEIYARAVFAPIAFSDFFQNGLHGGGWRYLKSFLAVALQGALILIITTIFAKLSQVLFGNFNDGIGYWAAMGQHLAFLISACMLMLKSLSLSKEIVGVQ